MKTPTTPPAPMTHPIRPEQSRIVGPYRLIEKIGEGWMGEIWDAEQTKPVRRRVALKLVKPGPVSRQVIARFKEGLLVFQDRPDRSDHERLEPSGSFQPDRCFGAGHHFTWGHRRRFIPADSRPKRCDARIPLIRGEFDHDVITPIDVLEVGAL